LANVRVLRPGYFGYTDISGGISVVLAQGQILNPSTADQAATPEG